MANLISQDFVFSQSNLNTFDYCRRRFYLRYIKQLIWPAQLVSDQQYTLDRDAGLRFHRLVHQYFLSFDTDLLRKVAETDPDPNIAVWFDTFLSSQMSRLEGKLFPEAQYTTTIAGHSLIAKVDLLQIDSGKVNIYDWKTSKQLPKRHTLQKNLQSKVYPLVISHVFNKDKNGPNIGTLTMLYWEANFPEQTIEINTSQADWQSSEDEITEIIQFILSLNEEEFPATPEIRKCLWCEYRSYCQRGAEAQSSEDMQEIDLMDDEMLIPGDPFETWGPV